MGDLIKCKDCGTEVSTDAKSCPKCGSTKYKPKKHTLLKILGGVFALGIIGNIIGTLSNDKSPSNTNRHGGISVNASSMNISSADHLNQARKFLKDGYEPNKDPMKTKWGNVPEARKHIEAIKPEDKEYAESRQLMKEVERRERDIKKVAEKVANKIMVSQRENYANEIEKIFLSSGMDVQVSTSGSDKTVLKLDYILWSRPLIYKFVNENNFLEGPKKAGFKKVVFYDTHNYSWTYKLD